VELKQKRKSCKEQKLLTASKFVWK